MNDRETMYKALTHAAWGYVFLYFDLNLNRVSLTPAFVGYLLFLSALEPLSKERRDLALLRPLGILLAAVNGVSWVMSWGGGGLFGRILPLDLLSTAVGLYFHFQFLTDLAAIAAGHRGPEDTLDRTLLTARTVHTVFFTVLNLWGTLAPSVLSAFPAAEDLSTALTFALLAGELIVMVYIVAKVFALRKRFAPPAEPA